MREKILLRQTYLEHAQNHIHVEFCTPHQVISSAILNGGLVQASHLVNLRVPKRWASLELERNNRWHDDRCFNGFIPHSKRNCAGH